MRCANTEQKKCLECGSNIFNIHQSLHLLETSLKQGNKEYAESLLRKIENEMNDIIKNCELSKSDDDVKRAQNLLVQSREKLQAGKSTEDIMYRARAIPYRLRDSLENKLKIIH